MSVASEAFKAEFRRTCKAAGLTLAETADCVDTARSLVKSGGLISSLSGDALANTVNTAKNLGTWGYFGIPIGAGALAGYGLAQMNDVNDEDPAEARTREEIDAYKHLSQEMAIKDRVRQMNQPTKARSPLVR